MTWKQAEQAASEIVSALLFEKKTELGGDGIESGEEFALVLQSFAPKATNGKFLTQLRLYERIFKYRCSYMIYSKAFTSLPELVRKRVFLKLREKTKESRWVREILVETVPGFIERQ